MKKKILLSLFVILVVIQFIQPAKNQSAELSASDISKVTKVPEDVQKILKTACYDCHSNNTVYPWYNNIQPVAWWLNHHVEEGKEHLNFSEFGTYAAKKANHKLHEVAETIEKGEMPLSSYTIIHKDAILSDEQKQLVIDWANNAVIADAGH
jgi:hypothetical protein